MCAALGLCLVWRPGAAPAQTNLSAEPASLFGSYLAGRLARGHHDLAKASRFYGRALERDPDNTALLTQAFQTEILRGNWDRAGKLADLLFLKEPNDRLVRMFLGLRAFKSGNFAAADSQLEAAAFSPIGELTAALARAWIKVADSNFDTAFARLDKMKDADWARFYITYHRALIADVAGDTRKARGSYDRLVREGMRTLRVVMAYAQHAAHHGDLKLAKNVLERLNRRSPSPHPLVVSLLQDLKGGKKPDILIATANDGLAEVFYGLGHTLIGEGNVEVGAIYLQLALYLKPRFPLALVALGNVYEVQKRYADANDVYQLIPAASPLHFSVQISRAFNLNHINRVEEAKTLLEDLHKQRPREVKVLDALGFIMRGRKRYAEAAVYYSKIISQLGRVEPKHWSYFYSRGVCYERLKLWPKAEADLVKAVELSPEQPAVLNYLGYSWVDQKRNLTKAMAYISKAVQLRPDDGYIVDSLGWAHYRLGNFKDAVKHLERAVELKSEDPVINDHLGDALWRVGRKREARFQWEQALKLKPEPEEIAKIKRKIEVGLPPLASPRLQRKARDGRRAARLRRGKESMARQPQP